MGNLEEGSKKRKRNQDLQKIILASIKVAGLLSVGLVAPNVLGTLSKLGILKSTRQREIIASSRKRLVAKGFLSYSPKGLLELTRKGEEKLHELERKEYRLNKPKRWDKKWRVLIFDIREERKRIREKVRNTLRAIGFYKLQDSVWIYPYDCEDFITLLKADFKIGKDLLYIIADSIENDASVRMYFGLS